MCHISRYDPEHECGALYGPDAGKGGAEHCGHDGENDTDAVRMSTKPWWSRPKYTAMDGGCSQGWSLLPATPGKPSGLVQKLFASN